MIAWWTLNFIKWRLTTVCAVLLALAAPLAAQQPINLRQVNGNTLTTGDGTVSAGTIRMVFATDGANPTTVFKINWAQIAGTTISVNNGTVDAGTVRVTVASNSSGVLGATQSGTWTVQPGNTANTTAWKVDGSAVTQPISAASLPLPSTAATSTKQSDGTQKTQIVDGSGNVIASTSNNLNVQCANCSGSGASAADEASMTEGTSVFAPSGGYFKTSITALTTGQQGMVALTASRSFHMSLYDASGNALLGSKTSANSIPMVIASDQAAVPASQSGTWNVTNVSGTVSLPTGASTAAKQPALGTAGTASADVITVQGIASMTKLLVTPDSVALPANQSVNVAQINGNTVTTGVGISGTGVPRFVDVASGTTGLAPPVQASYVGGLQSGATGGFLGGITVCDSKQTISVTSNTQLITGTSGRHVYICALNLVVAAATNVALVSGTGSTCATGIAGMAGGTTAATGWNFAANGGLAQGSGIGWILRTGATGDNVCILVSAANQTSGVLSYAIY